VDDGFGWVIPECDKVELHGTAAERLAGGVGGISRG